jgi:uncharacterized membrane protein YoaK (UPF0700 family)
LAACLAVTAGYVDGYGLLVLGTYVSFMSGNTTMGGVKTGQADFLAAVAPAVAVVFFVLGSLAGAVVAHARQRDALRMLLGLVAILLVIAALLGGHGALKDLSIALLTLAMGMMTQAMSHVGAEAVSVTFVTGMLNKIGNHLALALRKAPVPDAKGPWDSHWRRALIDGQMWAAFALGAAFAGAVVSHAPRFALLPAIAVMLVLALFSPAASPPP